MAEKFERASRSEMIKKEQETIEWGLRYVRKLERELTMRLKLLEEAAQEGIEPDRDSQVFYHHTEMSNGLTSPSGEIWIPITQASDKLEYSNNNLKEKLTEKRKQTK